MALISLQPWVENLTVYLFLYPPLGPVDTIKHRILYRFKQELPTVHEISAQRQKSVLLFWQQTSQWDHLLIHKSINNSMMDRHTTILHLEHTLMDVRCTLCYYDDDDDDDADADDVLLDNLDLLFLWVKFKLSLFCHFESHCLVTRYGK